jgi:hypothetical protein
VLLYAITNRLRPRMPGTAAKHPEISPSTKPPAISNLATATSTIPPETNFSLLFHDRSNLFVIHDSCPSRILSS